MLLSHKNLIRFVGVTWFAVGIFLLVMGMFRLQQAAHDLQIGCMEGHPLGQWLIKITGSVSNSILVIMFAALLLGAAKSRLALNKTLQRLIKRISSCSNPAPLSTVYGPSSLALVVAMVGLGVLMRLLCVPSEIRGLILLAVGFGLIRGALSALRASAESSVIGGTR